VAGSFGGVGIGEEYSEKVSTFEGDAGGLVFMQQSGSANHSESAIIG